MKIWLVFALVVGVLAQEDESDIEGPSFRPLENPNLYQGDILLPPGTDRNAIGSDYQRWTNRVVPFYIDPSLEYSRNRILAAMEEYHRKTCIRFVPWNNHREYVYIFAGNGCYSMVGRTGQNGQELSLGQGCLDHGTIVHELGHAVGFYHEQNRSDRDNYLTIYWNNILPNMRNQFDKMAPSQHRLLTGFDYDSIMLYGSTAFASSPGQITMTARNGARLQETFYKPGLSATDVRRINMLYQC